MCAAVKGGASFTPLVIPHTNKMHCTVNDSLADCRPWTSSEIQVAKWNNYKGIFFLEALYFWHSVGWRGAVGASFDASSAGQTKQLHCSL